MTQTADTLGVSMSDQGRLSLTVASWPGFVLRDLCAAVRLDGSDRVPGAITVERDGPEIFVHMDFGQGIRLVLHLDRPTPGLRLRSVLHNDGPVDVELQDVVLLGGGTMALGVNGAGVRVLEQGNYWGHVRNLGTSAAAAAAADGEGDESQARSVTGTSDHVWVAWDPVAQRGLLAGFLTSERWQGRVEISASTDGIVQSWRLGFDGADVCLPAGSATSLEEAVLSIGDDPWRLLEEYGDHVAARHNTVVTEAPPVTWCSWYPYRLGVTQERVLETACIAAQRLQPLGLSKLLVDLGWQAGNLPSTFDENERFPDGLRWLADRLEELELGLGVWSAPYSVSEFDPLASEHPEYLIQDEDGTPVASGSWFWEPHGKVHILDLTHPGARAWLLARLASLAARGVTYLKPDFIGCITNPAARRRHDRTIAAGGGTQAGRLGASIMQQALPGASILNCGGPEMPGTGAQPLLYTCNDTGNTGFLATDFRRRNTHALACHLWKNRRWGIIQPSCLCVGLPGTLEEARQRATIAFLAGGQIDISDTLTTLPEDRWAVLAATLPSLGRSATPVDLFEPLPAMAFGYEQSTRGQGEPVVDLPDLPAGSVWHLHVDAGWDSWELVGLLAFPEDVDATAPGITRFVVPLERLGLAADDERVGFEFWSRQYLGSVPGGRRNRGGYTHPGDYQDLLSGDAPGALDVSFHGPAARLLCLRRRRRHPWVAGTGFHQSCGTELSDVSWDESSAVLSGVLQRPPAETGVIVLSSAARDVRSVEVDGRLTPWHVGANGSIVLPLLSGAQSTHWSVTFQ